MDFSIDLSYFLELGSRNPFLILFDLILKGGWVLFVLVGLGVWYKYYQYKTGGKWDGEQKRILLAIDVPRENLTNPRAVENIFAQFAGAHGTFTWWETYIECRSQLPLSLELVSYEGHIQFLIYTPDKFRDTIEAAIYAQYPDAEITEVEDYTKDAPDYFPNDEYDLFGCEFVQVKHEVFPIRTYEAFKDEFTGDLVDPMAGLLEMMGRIGPGEQIWVQFVLTPISDSWKKAAKEFIDEVLEKNAKHGDGLITKVFGYILSIPLALIKMVNVMATGVPFEEEEKEESHGKKMMDLTPGEKDRIEAIEHKTSKIGFKTRIRLVYLAKKDNFKKSKVLQPFVGAIKQFNTANLNAIKPETKVTGTVAHYFRVKQRVAKRQRRIMASYKGRSNAHGAPGTGENEILGSVFNIEELATLWHFPTASVKSPLVSKASARRGEPPVSLPVQSGEGIFDEGEVTAPPTDASFDFDFTDKFFERRFAKHNAVVETEMPKTEEIPAEMQQPPMEMPGDLQKEEPEVVEPEPKKESSDELPPNLPIA